MNAKRFEPVKVPHVTHVAGYLMERRGWSEDEAIRRSMTSEVYDRLQDEESRTWYLSSYHSHLLFEDELEGEPVWPDMY